MRRALFIGVDLQRDFLEPEGALPTRGAEATLAGASRLLQHAANREIPVLLTQDTHTSDDPSFEAFPPHGILDTPGHDLSPELGLGGVTVVPDGLVADLDLALPRPVVAHGTNHRQGFFGNVNADRILETIDAEEHVVFGLPAEIGVRSMVMGLLQRKRTTIVVSDVLGHLDPDRSSFLLAAWAASGCHFLPLEAVLQRYA